MKTLNENWKEFRDALYSEHDPALDYRTAFMAGALCFCQAMDEIAAMPEKESKVAMSKIQNEVWEINAHRAHTLLQPVTINPKEDAFYRRVEECTVYRVLAKRVDELEGLLTSARAIAERSGACTAWERFSERLAKAGIGHVTPYTFRIPPSDGP